MEDTRLMECGCGMHLAEERNVQVEGKCRHVYLAKTDTLNEFIADVDDRRYHVKLASGFDKNSSTFNARINGKNYKIQLEQRTPESVTVRINGKSFAIQQLKTEAKTMKNEQIVTPPLKTAPEKLPLNKNALFASMPGKIVALKVNRGDRVKAGHVLCILEAMKMENEITIQKDSVVKEILVSEGKGVNKGDPMFLVEPLED